MTYRMLSDPRLGGTAARRRAGRAARRSVSRWRWCQPITEYKLYVTRSLQSLVKETKAFTAAVKAGDVAKAKALFAPTRTHYEQIEPIAELFSDLDGSIDSRADDHELAEKDPGFTGFHRIEYGLWIEDSTAGLEPFADKLMADVNAAEPADHRSGVPAGGGGRWCRGADGGSRGDQDLRRGGSLQPHRSVGLPGQRRWLEEDLGAVQPAPHRRLGLCREGERQLRHRRPDPRQLPDAETASRATRSSPTPTAPSSPARSTRWPRTCPSSRASSAWADTRATRARAGHARAPIVPATQLRGTVAS